MSTPKVGEVWLVEAGCWSNRKMALRLAEGWSHVNGVNVDGDGVVSAVRPLVVIDPEDRGQVERLRNEFDAAWLAHSGDSLPISTLGARGNALQAALRSLITPPKPEEPLGLGAVVEDADGIRFVRTDDEYPWQRAASPTACKWSAFAAVRVLSVGVTP